MLEIYKLEFTFLVMEWKISYNMHMVLNLLNFSNYIRSFANCFKFNQSMICSRFVELVGS